MVISLFNANFIEHFRFGGFSTEFTEENSTYPVEPRHAYKTVKIEYLDEGGKPGKTE